MIYGFPRGSYIEIAPDDFYRWDERGGFIPLRDESEQITEDLQAAFDSIKLVEDKTTPEEDYVLKVLDKDAGRIVIRLLENAYYDSTTKELILVFSGQAPIKINVSDLIDIYTGDNVTIEVNNNVISLKPEVFTKINKIDNILQEIQELKNKDNELESGLTEEKQAREQKDNELESGLTEEKQAREQKDNELESGLTEEKQAREQKDNELESGLTEEKQAREEKDNELVKKIDDAVDDLNKRIDDEVGDDIEQLEKKIDDEISARTAAIEALDYNDSVSDGQVVVAVNQNDGLINVNKKNLKVQQVTTTPGMEKTYDFTIGDTSVGKIDIPFCDSVLFEAKLADTNATLDSNGHIIPGSPKGDDALVMSFKKSDGTFDIVKVDISSILVETEFKDGLAVVNHEVAVNLGSDNVYLKFGDETSSNKSVRANIVPISSATSTNTGLADAFDVKTSISAESAQLSSKIDKEIQDRTDADNDLLTKLNTEISDRISGDTDLANQIAQEITNRTTAIALEQTVREAKDTLLETKIQQLELKHDTEIAALQAKDIEIEGNLVHWGTF